MTDILLIIIAVLLLIIAAMALLVPAHLSRLNDHAVSLRRKARRLKSIESKLGLLVEKMDNSQDGNMPTQADKDP
jgi:uncharacterized protein YxeA